MILPHLLLFIGVLLSGLATFLAVSTILDSVFNTKLNALTWASGDAPKKSKSGVIRLTRPIVHRMILPLIARYKLQRYKENIKREIQSAGLADELNENEYIGLQILLGAMIPLVLIAGQILFKIEYPVWMIFTFAVFGYAFPNLYVRTSKGERRRQILIDLPFVVDLLALSTEAGLDFIGAISRVVDKMTGGALAEELGQVLRDLKLGSSRAESLNAMAWRLNMSEISSFVAVLVTADSLGASIGTVLRQQSEQMRQERFTRAEKAGAEASQKIFIPLILFILPAVLLMVFGPVILQFFGSGK